MPDVHWPSRPSSRAPSLTVPRISGRRVFTGTIAWTIAVARELPNVVACPFSARTRKRRVYPTSPVVGVYAV